MERGGVMGGGRGRRTIREEGQWTWQKSLGGGVLVHRSVGEGPIAGIGVCLEAVRERESDAGLGSNVVKCPFGCRKLIS